MNIVFLLDSYYPHRNPSANCADLYIQKLKLSHDISIITPTTSQKYKHQFCISGVNVYPITNYWNSLRNIANCSIADQRYVILNKILLLAVRIYGLFLSIFSFPTRFAWLIKKYVSTIESILTEKPIDVIISVSDPICTHLAAQRIKKKYPQIKWITYTTDPFTYSERNKKKSKQIRQKYAFMEKSIYEDSDANMFTQELYDFNVKNFNISYGKNFAFPYVLTDFSGLEFSEKHMVKSPIMLYAGALMKKIRHPEFALSILSNLKFCEIYFYTAGDCGDILKKYESENIHIGTLVPRDKYLYLITQEADILINIGNSNDLQSPSKFLELISTGKPIVNFYKKIDSNYKMAEKYPLGINIGKDDIDPINKLSEFCKDKVGKRLSFEELKVIFPDNIFENQVQKLESLLNV